MRRSFASTLLESGAGLHDASAFLGHANITTTSRYLRSTVDRLAAVLARMEGDEPTATTEAPKAPAAPSSPDVIRTSFAHEADPAPEADPGDGLQRLLN